MLLVLEHQAEVLVFGLHCEPLLLELPLVLGALLIQSALEVGAIVPRSLG